MKLLRLIKRKFPFTANKYAFFAFIVMMKMLLDFQYVLYNQDVSDPPTSVHSAQYVNGKVIDFLKRIKSTSDDKSINNQISEVLENSNQIFNNASLNKIQKALDLIVAIRNKNGTRFSELATKIPELGQVELLNKPAAGKQPALDAQLEKNYYMNRNKVVNTFNYNYSILPSKKICTDKISLVILVHSLAEYYEGRKSIRETWGSVAYSNKPKWPGISEIKQRISIVFVTAIQANSSFNDYLQREAEMYGDILQGNFIDAYTNMTLKSLLGLKYVSEYCSMVPYMAKNDDDMFVNIPFLLEKLFVNKAVPPRSVCGPYNPKSRVDRVGKWGVPEKLYPMKFYPPYMSGAFYIITTDIVKELYKASNFMPYFHVDDAYITGVLVKVIKAKHIRLGRMFSYWGSPKPTPCDIVKRKMITFTKCVPKYKYYLWGAISSGVKCF